MLGHRSERATNLCDWRLVTYLQMVEDLHLARWVAAGVSNSWCRACVEFSGSGRFILGFYLHGEQKNKSVVSAVVPPVPVSKVHTHTHTQTQPTDVENM